MDAGNSRNFAVAAVSVILIGVGLYVQGIIVARGWIAVSSSRKTAHIALGLLLLLSWPLYDSHESARWLVAIAPFVAAAYFVAMGFGLRVDERTLRAAAREGHAREMLLGPTLYVLAFGLLPMFFWRSPISAAALSFLVFGDALAEIFGRRIRSRALPWNRSKTVAGSAAALVGGWLGCLLVFWVFNVTGYLPDSLLIAWKPLIAVAVVGSLTESVASGSYDNVLIVGACSVAGHFVF